MNEKYILAVITVVIAGCTWESELYQNFVDEKGDKRPVFCPKDAAKTGTELSKISMSCEKCENGVYTITREECKSKDNCGDDTILTQEQKEILSLAFKYNACPQKSEQFAVGFSCDKDKSQQYYCKQGCGCEVKDAEETKCINEDRNNCEVIICNEGYHIDESKSKCIVNTTEACGSRYEFDVTNCFDLEGVKDKKVTCISEEARCFILECENGYHISSDNTKCQENTFNNCGRAGYSCLYEKGWKDTLNDNNDNNDNLNDKCDKETGRCVAGEDDCFVGFHVFNGFDENENYFSCERNNLLNCGGHGVDCAVEKNNHPEWDEYKCNIETGKCVPISCATTHHMTKKGNCVENNNKACGSEDFSCLDIPGFIESGTNCDNGKCVANKCDDGFNINVENNLCVPQNCPNDKYYAMCNGVCKTIYEDAKNCGKCGKECIPDIGTDKVKCVQGKCEFTCQQGFHLNDNASYCEKDTDEKCGNDLLNCKEETNSYSNTIGKCVNGECFFYCNENYYDCDDNPMNGCEISSNELGLKSCTECKDGYTACGALYPGSMIPLCILQGYHYKNYSNGEKDKFQKSLKLNQYYHSVYYRFVYYDYKNYDMSPNFNGDPDLPDRRYYKLIGNQWDKKINGWNSQECEKACGTSPNSNYKDGNNNTAWGHACKSTQRCDMFDSRNNQHFYVDYGCNY